MNSVILIGRLTKDPDIRYSGETAVARFNLAIDRIGKEKQTDFPSVVCFGKTAENVEKFVKKGTQICINGSIQTGSYQKDGKTYYTTDVVASRVEFLGSKKVAEEVKPEIPEGFEKISDEEIPF